VEAAGGKGGGGWWEGWRVPGEADRLGMNLWTTSNTSFWLAKCLHLKQDKPNLFQHESRKMKRLGMGIIARYQAVQFRLRSLSRVNK